MTHTNKLPTGSAQKVLDTLAELTTAGAIAHFLFLWINLIKDKSPLTFDSYLAETTKALLNRARRIREGTNYTYDHAMGKVYSHPLHYDLVSSLDRLSTLRIELSAVQRSLSTYLAKNLITQYFQRAYIAKLKQSESSFREIIEHQCRQIDFTIKHFEASLSGGDYLFDFVAMLVDFREKAIALSKESIEGAYSFGSYGPYAMSNACFAYMQSNAYKDLSCSAPASSLSAAEVQVVNALGPAGLEAVVRSKEVSDAVALGKTIISKSKSLMSKAAPKAELSRVSACLIDL